MVLVATQVKRRRGTTAENDAFTGAEGEITVDTEKHQLRVHDGETQGGFVIGSGGSGRNIGDIFYTKRTDTGLAGAVECNGGTYNTEDYTGAGSIGELLAGGKLDYISLTDYATAISTKGYCDKIGWDGTGTTSFRVPKLAPRRYVVKEQKPTAGNNYTWYRLYNDGWTEQGGQRVGNKTVSFPVAMADTNYFTLINSMFNNSGTATWFDLGYIETKLVTGMTKGGSAANYNWFVAGMSAITSDPTERAMFQLFNGTTDEAVATVGGVLADVAGLKDMSNVTSTGKETAVGWGMPDYSIIKETISDSNIRYADKTLHGVFTMGSGGNSYVEVSKNSDMSNSRILVVIYITLSGSILFRIPCIIPKGYYYRKVNEGELAIYNTQGV